MIKLYRYLFLEEFFDYENIEDIENVVEYVNGKCILLYVYYSMLLLCVRKNRCNCILFVFEEEISCFLERIIWSLWNVIWDFFFIYVCV